MDYSLTGVQGTARFRGTFSADDEADDTNEALGKDMGFGSLWEK